MSARVYVPSDSGARALGADAVASALAGLAGGFDIVRNGSRGLYWLEPLVEVEADGERLGFGPLAPAQIPELFGAGAPGRAHPLCLGAVAELPELKAQTRVTCWRCGVIDPLSLEDYIAHGGFQGLANARGMAPRDIVAAVAESGLRGRGGAAFPTGVKWRTVLDADAATKYVVCNADEGDSGTFADRLIMEADPLLLVEGMAIAALAVGAAQAYIYVRSEYPQSIASLRHAIALAERGGHLDGLRIQVREAAGAYICGEETAMLESLEGKRGMVRYRPPLPAVKGLFGRPTVINNVISLASVPAILADGAGAYHSHGSGRSRGTLTVQLAGNVKRGGLYEVPFGLPLRALLEELGGGTLSGRPIKAVQVGGPLGAYVPPAHFDTPMDYESFKGIGAMLGHGGVVVFDDGADLGRMARFAMAFCAEESCGKCTPCRIGAVRGAEVIDRIRAGEDANGNRILLRELCETMIDGSLCGLGAMAPLPVLSIMEHFSEEL